VVLTKNNLGGGSLVNSRRSELDIISEIIKLSRDGARKTEILYQGNLSYTQLQNYLFFLIDKGIIEEKQVGNGNGGTNRIYMVTEKGNNLLSDINKTMSYLK
jgi:predicted transcriptional regulator